MTERWERIQGALKALRSYLMFFLLVAFIVTCCMVLFLNTILELDGVVWDRSSMEVAAKVTLGNVLLLSLICTVIDGVRRWFMVELPARRIAEAAERIARGDFSVRVPHTPTFAGGDEFNRIAGCFNRMAEELAGMETLRDDFVSNVSHEMKTPLAVIQSYAGMLRRPDLPESRRMTYATAITEASAGLASLITNILRLNRLENQRIYPATRPYDLGEQLRGCLLGFEESWQAKELSIIVDIADDLAMVDSDPELLSLVWNNLISNAIKFTEPHGTISLSLHVRDGHAVVCVGDTGCGIDSDIGRHIFEKFYQGDTSHATQGNGLGLALVRRVVDIVGGDISVSSEVGVGSTFTVTLRCVTEDGAV